MNVNNDWVPVPRDFFKFFKLTKNKHCLQLYLFVLLNAQRTETINPDGTPSRAGDYTKCSRWLYEFLGMTRCQFRRALKELSDNFLVYFKGTKGRDMTFTIRNYGQYQCSNFPQGWVKLYREVSIYEWFMDGNVAAVYLSLLLRANIDKKFSLRDVTTEVGLDIKTVLNCMKTLRRNGVLRYNKTRSKDVYSIAFSCGGKSLPYNTPDTPIDAPKTAHLGAKCEPVAENGVIEEAEYEELQEKSDATNVKSTACENKEPIQSQKITKEKTLNISKNPVEEAEKSTQDPRITDTEPTHSKNKSKINIKNNKRIFTSMRACACEEEGEADEATRESGYVKALKSNLSWQGLVMKKLSMEEEGTSGVMDLLDQFNLDNQCTFTYHASLNDFARHFIRWALIMRRNEPPEPARKVQGACYSPSSTFSDIPFWDKDRQREFMSHRRMANAARLADDILHNEPNMACDEILNW